MYLNKILFFFTILIYFKINKAEDADIEIYDEKPILPQILEDPQNCPINACEGIKILSQYVVAKKTIGNPKTAMPTSEEPISTPASYLGKIDPFTMEFELQKRVRQIESRLRAVEQPNWKLTTAGKKMWNLCTSGVCRCNPDTKSFTCWRQNLISVPPEQIIPMSMVYIDLSRNLLSTLHKNTFQGLTLLMELDLSNNILDFLPFNIFRDCDSLVQLRLQSNKLEDIDHRTFWKLRNLNLLDMSKNMLRELPETIFFNIQRLRVINLSENRIKKISTLLLNDQYYLEEMDMSRNNIQILENGTFIHLQKIKIIDFSKNEISVIEDDAFFNLISLKTLVLHSNKISAISSKLFKNLKELETLDLTLNKINYIHSDAFSRLSNLKELMLGQNGLSAVPNNLFLPLGNLEKLMFHSNNLSTLKNHFFNGLTSLKLLSLNNNYLRTFDYDVFQPLRKLEKLRIDSNKLQYLPHAALDNLPKLKAVKLDKNPWHCDCKALYLARWMRASITKLWDGHAATCRGPGALGGHEVGLMRYDDLCTGQWASMLSLSPRLPVRQNQILEPKNHTDSMNMYFKNSSLTSSGLNISLINVLLPYGPPFFEIVNDTIITTTDQSFADDNEQEP